MKKKPQKPRSDFPLFPHRNGQWAKKVRGKLQYFGTDWQSAESEWLRVKDDLLAGRSRPPTDVATVTVRNACNEFLTFKDSKVKTGELAYRTFLGYMQTAGIIADAIGTRPVDSLTVEDFKNLRNIMADGRGLRSLAHHIKNARGVFSYAWRNELIDKPVRFGDAFSIPSRANVKKESQQKRQDHGKRLFTSEQMRMLLESSRPFGAMALLAINGGLGNTDISGLHQTAIEGDWLDVPRQKTGVERRIPLWPETSEALNEAIAHRPSPKDKADSGLVFITRYGNRFVRISDNGAALDSISDLMKKRTAQLGIKRPGLSFYAIRHTFETIAGGSKDQVAVDHIMGHDRGDMASEYRESIDDDRLRAVTNHVRTWLLGE